MPRRCPHVGMFSRRGPMAFVSDDLYGAGEHKNGRDGPAVAGCSGYCGRTRKASKSGEMGSPRMGKGRGCPS